MKIEKQKSYPINSCFKNRETLEKAIGGHHPQEDGTFLLAASNKYQAFYVPEKDKIILKLSDLLKSDEERIGATLEFFRKIESCYEIDKY